MWYYRLFHLIPYLYVTNVQVRFNNGFVFTFLHDLKENVHFSMSVDHHLLLLDVFKLIMQMKYTGYAGVMILTVYVYLAMIQRYKETKLSPRIFFNSLE